MSAHLDNINRPRVSVITPFLDNEAFLPEAIESVISQTFGDWEYLLVDDGSNSAATLIAQEYATRYPRKIRYLEHDDHRNRGISATRNLGVRHARGEFIAFLDSDDIWLPSKLAEHVAVLDAHPEVGMVCGTTIVWNSWSNGPDRIFLTGHRQDTVIYPPEAVVELYPLGKERAPSFSDVIFRAEIVRRLGGFEDQFTDLYDDQVLLVKVHLSTPVYYCSTISNKYRQHATSICAKAIGEKKNVQSRIKFLEWFDQYLRTIDNVDPHVTASLRRNLRSHRNPRFHYLHNKLDVRNGLRIRTRLRSVVRRIRSKPLILMYHRIADVPIDPWDLAVSQAYFAEQLDVLRRTRKPLPLTEFIGHLAAGTLPSNAVAITFDDGYVDNLVTGKPLLAAADIPATIFLATGYLGRSEAFWWDELTSLFLLGSGPEIFELAVRDKSIRFDFNDEPPPTAGTASATPRKRRIAVLLRVWQMLRDLEDDERRLVIEKVRLLFGGIHHRACWGRPMTGAEVRAIASDNLITIGAHTVTHPALSYLKPAACHHEISESKRACEALVGAPIAQFAYPYGDFNADAREAVRASGFSAAFSIQNGPATVKSDILALPRVHVRNLDGHAFERALASACKAD